jgi:hypothetical protein
MAFSLGTTAGAGTITIAAGGSVVTGVGTNFQTANIGAIIVVGSQWGVIATRTSTTSITLDRVFTTAVTASAYQISANIPVITQTGTDTSLAALTGVPGVTTSLNLWTITSATLVINGSLTINRLTNRLRFLNTASVLTASTTVPAMQVGTTGVFNNSVVQSLNGYSFKSPSYSILFDVAIPASSNTTAVLIYGLLGSSMTLEGDIEYTNILTFNLMFGTLGTITLQNGAFINSNASGSNYLVFSAGVASTISFVNWSNYGTGLRVGENTTNINNYAAIAGPYGININTSVTINNAQYTGLQDLGNAESFRFLAGLKFVQFINFSSTRLVPLAFVNSTAGSQYLLVNQLRLTATGAIGNIPDVKFWARDSNNGLRYSANYGAGQAYEIATTGDLTYTATTNASGVALTLNVISAVYYQPTATTYLIDYRGNNGAQDLNIYQCAYNYVLSNSLTNLWPLNSGIYGGVAVRNQGFVLLTDTSITEPIMANVAAYNFLNTRAELYDYAKYYLYTNFAGQTATYITADGNAGSYNVIINQSAVNVFTPTGSSLAIKSANFTGDITTSGSVILANGSIVSNNNIDAPNVIQDIPTDLSGVEHNGNWNYSTNTNITVTFNNCNIQGGVSNTGSGNIIINLLNSTIGSEGAGVTSRLVTNFTINGIEDNSQIYIADDAGNQIEYVANSGTSYSINTTGGTGDWSYKVARYGFITQEGIFTPAVSSTTVTITLIADEFVVDDLPNVIAYTDLDSTQKIKDYSSYFGTTNAGIIIGTVLSKGFGTLTVPAGLTLNPTAVALFAVSSGVVTTKTSGLNEATTILSSGDFTQGAATLSNSITIRSANLDSELLFVADSITLYPTSNNRDTNTNAGPTSTTGIIRFLYNSVVSGVTMGGAAFLRVDAGIILFSDITIIQGNNTLDYGTTGQLTILNAKVDELPQDVWNYTERTLNKALFK